jgi:hypothetical protein
MRMAEKQPYRAQQQQQQQQQQQLQPHRHPTYPPRNR